MLVRDEEAKRGSEEDMQRFSTLRFAATVGLTLAFGTPSGETAKSSSRRQPRDRPPDLVYTGQIRDKVTRRPINDVIYFLITDKRSGLDFPFVNDAPGHYRSPDVGASVRDLGRVTVDPTQLEIQVAVSGYKTQTLDKLPRKNNRPHRRRFQDGTRSPHLARRHRDRFENQAARRATGGWIGLGGLFAALIAALAARTLVPRQSTAR